MIPTILFSGSLIYICIFFCYFSFTLIHIYIYIYKHSYLLLPLKVILHESTSILGLLLKRKKEKIKAQSKYSRAPFYVISLVFVGHKYTLSVNDIAEASVFFDRRSQLPVNAMTLRLKENVVSKRIIHSRSHSNAYMLTFACYVKLYTYHISKCTRTTQTLLYSNFKHLLNLLIRLQVKDSEAVFVSSHLRSQIAGSFFANFKFGTDNKRPSLFACFIFTIFISLGGFISQLSANVKLTGRTASDFSITFSLSVENRKIDLFLSPSITGLFAS